MGRIGTRLACKTGTIYGVHMDQSDLALRVPSSSSWPSENGQATPVDHGRSTSCVPRLVVDGDTVEVYHDDDPGRQVQDCL